MKILILTGYDDNIKELGEACDRSKSLYAEFHGYDFHCKRDYHPGTHPSWQKIGEIRRYLPNYDAVVWLDSDTVITDCDLKIEDIVSDRRMTVSQDWCAPVDDPTETTRWVSCGNFIIRNIPDGGNDEWFDKIERNEIRFGNRACWEQDSVIENMRHDPKFREQVCVLPRHVLNSVAPEMEHPNRPSHPWQPGAFLCHLTCFSPGARVTAAHKYHEIFMESLAACKAKQASVE